MTSEEILELWRAKWPEAVRAWSKYIQLREPRFILSNKESAKAGLVDSFAMFKLDDHESDVNLEEIAKLGLEDLAVPIMAHEVGHHIICPSSYSDSARLIAVINSVVSSREASGLISNLFSDLIINYKLHKRGIRIVEVYRRLCAKTPNESELWNFYMRIYELLCELAPGTLCVAKLSRNADVDALLASKVVRAYQNNWLSGARKFATIIANYLPPSDAGLKTIYVLDKPCPLGENVPTDAIDVNEAEAEALDGELGYLPGEEYEKYSEVGKPTTPNPNQRGNHAGQHRTPAEFGQIMKDLGSSLKPADLLYAYYKNLAQKFILRMPAVREKQSDVLKVGPEPWEFGEDLDKIDWEATLYESPVVVPGLTTRKRGYEEFEVGADEMKDQPLDLDIYVDSSGSMPNPAFDISYLTLAAVILVLNALRAGAKVQATVWSGYGQFKSTRSFMTDDRALIDIVASYIGDGTGFPLNVLRDTYAARKETDPPAHIIVISDEGVDTMLSPDEKKINGEAIVKTAIAKARCRGSMVLNLHWHESKELKKLVALGLDLYKVTDWSELLKFADEFSRKNYGKFA